MNVKLLYLSVIFSVSFFSLNANAQKKSLQTVKVKIPPPSKIENEIVEEINFARTKPDEYAKMLEGLRSYYNGNNFTLPGRKPFRTTEGVATLNEVIEELKVLKPLAPLALNCSDVRASRDQFADLQKSGAVSHFGSNGSSPRERLKKYLGGVFYSSENLVGRNGTARDIVLMMLLDDGLPERPHRKNLLDSRFTFAGIANGENIKKLSITVAVFSDSSADKEPCEIK